MPDAIGPEKVTVQDINNAPPYLPARFDATDDDYSKLFERHKIVSEQNNELAEENARLKRRNATIDRLDSLIKPFAYSTFIFMISYCIFVAWLICERAWGNFTVPLSDGVVETLVGSTAATVIGLVGMVLTGIFLGARPK